MKSPVDEGSLVDIAALEHVPPCPSPEAPPRLTRMRSRERTRARARTPRIQACERTRASPRGGDEAARAIECKHTPNWALGEKRRSFVAVAHAACRSLCAAWMLRVRAVNNIIH